MTGLMVSSLLISFSVFIYIQSDPRALEKPPDEFLRVHLQPEHTRLSDGV